MARIFVTTKMDDERADFYKAFNGIVAKFGTMVCPIVVPIITGGKVVSYYNMLTGRRSLTTAQRQRKFLLLPMIRHVLTLSLKYSTRLLQAPMKRLWKNTSQVKSSPQRIRLRA
jgi:hypothetical protein